MDKDTELLTSLFSSYQSGKRPSCGNGEPVQVKIGLAIRQIIDLVSMKGIYQFTSFTALSISYKFVILFVYAVSRLLHISNLNFRK